MALVSRSLPPVLAALLALAACSGDPPPRAAGPNGERDQAAIRASVEVERTGAGPPDGGAAGGHGGDAVASTGRSQFLIRGQVHPPDSAVALVRAGSGRRQPATVGSDGRFAVRATRLRPGANFFRLLASKPGWRAWSLDVRITRRAP